MRSGLEVGSLEVTRATGAGGVSSERRGAGHRGREARGAGNRDTQVCGFGCRGGLTHGWRGIGVHSDPEGQRGLGTQRTVGCGQWLLGAAAPGLAPSGPGRPCARMIQLSRHGTQLCIKAWNGSRGAMGSRPASAAQELRSEKIVPNLGFPLGKRGKRVSFAGNSAETLRYGE